MQIISQNRYLIFLYSVEASSGSGLVMLCASSEYCNASKSNDVSLPISDSEFMELVRELIELVEDSPFPSSGHWLVLDIAEYGWSFSSLFSLVSDSGSILICVQFSNYIISILNPNLAISSALDKTSMLGTHPAFFSRQSKIISSPFI